MRRVAVTGLGVISAAGHTANEFWHAVRCGRSGIGPIQSIAGEDLEIAVAAQVRDFDPADHFDRARQAQMDRFAQFAVIAAREAMAESHLVDEAYPATRVATIIGTSIGGQVTQDDAYRRLYGEGRRRSHPFVVPRIMTSAPASQVTMDLGLTGPAYVVSSACASAGHAIGQAFHMIRAGAVDAALAGGAEASITYGSLKSWEALRLMAPDTCRPFSLDRRGMVLGEGAAILALEPLDGAMERGATVHAELVGYGATSDASDLVRPSPEGAARAICAALEDAGLNADEVDYVNAHGTGTTTNDIVETEALHRAFGAHAARLTVSSTKAVHGHALGASPALEMVATVCALRDGVAPPTANYTAPDPKCDLDYVPSEAREMTMRVALSNSFAFGGLNAVLAARRADYGPR